MAMVQPSLIVNVEIIMPDDAIEAIAAFHISDEDATLNGINRPYL